MTPEKLYDLYGEKMFHYAALRLGSSEDAEDVLQETFFRLARYPIRWAFIKDTKAFVFKVLRNETNRFLRRKIGRATQRVLTPEVERRIAEIPSDPAWKGEISADRIALGYPPQVRPSVNPSGELLSTQTADALSALPDEQREVVILKIFQDLSFKEIASVCGLSINTAASRYRYALEKLRSSIGREK